MKCLYCERRLGFFRNGKGAFCSEQHEELYRNATQRRLEAPYSPSAGVLENSPIQAEGQVAQAPEGQVAQAADLAQLLKATQVESGASVETPAAEVVITAHFDEAVMASVENSTVAATSIEVPEAAYQGPSAPRESSQGPRAGSPGEAPPLSNASASPLPEPPSTISAATEEDTDRRSEPRIKDIKILKIAPLRQPERDMSCALVDTSGTGIQFTSDADLRVGEILIAELPDQFVLAEVRYSQAKGERFAIGAERVQSVSKDAMAQAGSGLERAGVLIEALCDRVRTGFADEPGHDQDAPGGDQRQRALDRVARILEIWQKMQANGISQAEQRQAEQRQAEQAQAEQPEPQAEPAASGATQADSELETPADVRHSSGAGRAFAAVGACLVLAGLLTVCVLQFRSGQVSNHPGVAAAIKPQAKPAPDAKRQVVAQQVRPQPATAPSVQTPAPAQAPQTPPVQQHAAIPAKAAPIAPQAPAPAIVGLHRAQIRALQTTWVGVSTDGKKVFGAMITKGSTKDLEFSKFAFLHAGNAAGIEITLDGTPVPMGTKPGLRLVELNSTGFRFLHWSNDDPPQP
jgi:Domain of unknown function (DUF4115)